jgi:hypothetical protein
LSSAASPLPLSFAWPPTMRDSYVGLTTAPSPSVISLFPDPLVHAQLLQQDALGWDQLLLVGHSAPRHLGTQFSYPVRAWLFLLPNW